MDLVESWKRALDRGENVGAIMMDLSKAFDCLSHKLLIAKRNANGFSINAGDIILNYLSNCQQRVKIGYVFSRWMDLTMGEPKIAYWGLSFSTCSSMICISLLNLTIFSIMQMITLYHTLIKISNPYM